MITIRACAAVALAAILLPAAAGAATVQVTEETLQQSPLKEEARLEFEAGTGEANRLRIAFAGTEQGKARYDLRDDGAAITAGPGCSGGGAPGAVVSCLVPLTRPGTCGQVSCEDLGRTVRLSFELGDGDDLLIASTLPAGDGGGGPLLVEAAGGDGADELFSGRTSDRFDPGPGADTVKTRRGNDFADAGATPDGPDSFDLGDGFNTISYADRDQPVKVTLDGLPGDGAAGERDEVEAEVVIGGSAADRLIGGDSRVEGLNGYAEELFGGGGGDVLIGNGGPDRGHGGAGDDRLLMMGGDDFGSGGRGDDSVEGQAGSDRLEGGANRDRLDGGSRNGRGDRAADRLDCGPGAHDHAFHLEPADRARRCERIHAGGRGRGHSGRDRAHRAGARRNGR